MDRTILGGRLDGCEFSTAIGGTGWRALTVATLTDRAAMLQTRVRLRDSVIAKARQAGERTAKILRQRWPTSRQSSRWAIHASRDHVHVAEETGADMSRAWSSRARTPRSDFRRELPALRRRSVRALPCRDRPRSTAAGTAFCVAVDGSRLPRRAPFSVDIRARSRRPGQLLRMVPAYVSSGLHGPGARFPDRLPAEDRRKQQRGRADALLADAAALFAEARRPVRAIGFGGQRRGAGKS